jgi:hypothetical protein
MHLFVQIHPVPGQRLPQSFEGLAAALSNLPGMFFEMDGSFVWVDHQSHPPRQMDAMVYDRDGRLEYVDVKGDCNLEQWQALCHAICNLDISEDTRMVDDLSIDAIIRVHWTQTGDWTTVGEISTKLAIVSN